jgi:hypothetical protein
LLVALVAGAIVAIAATNGDEEGAAASGTAGTGTGAFVDTGVAIPPADTGGEAVAPPAGPPPEPAGPPPPPPQTGPVKWPSGKNGYTNVLASIDADQGFGAAGPTVRKAIDAGLPDVGTLDSSNFSSLNPGFIVVFSGIYDTRNEAQAGLAQARGPFPLAYPREISN